MTRLTSSIGELFSYEFKRSIIKLEKKLNINSVRDWYKVEPKTISRRFYNRYKSIHLMLQDIYPYFIWSEWKFTTKPHNCFENKRNRRYFIDHTGENLSIKYATDWYKIKNNNIVTQKAGLFSHYENLFHCISAIYCEQEWIPWKFNTVPAGFWDSLSNQKYYFKTLEKELNITSKEQCYNISPKNIHTTLYLKYSSLITLLQNIYPNYIWLPWKFPFTFWSGINAKMYERQYFDFIAESKSIKNYNSWYSLTTQDIYKQGHTSFLYRKYKSLLPFTLEVLYPEIHWFPWKFTTVPNGFWENDENLLDFLSYCEKKLNFKSKSEWYFVSQDQFQNLGGQTLLLKFKSIQNILQYVYPDEKWAPKTYTYFGLDGK